MLALSSARRLPQLLLLRLPPVPATAACRELLLLQVPPGPELPSAAAAAARGSRACSSSSSWRQRDDDDDDEDNPVVFLDVGADNQPLGRVILEVPSAWLTTSARLASPRQGALAPRTEPGWAGLGLKEGRERGSWRQGVPKRVWAPLRTAQGEGALCRWSCCLPGPPSKAARWALLGRGGQFGLLLLLLLRLG